MKSFNNVWRAAEWARATEKKFYGDWSKETRQLLADGDALAAYKRRAFELYRLGGLTQREVADELGISTTLVNFMIRDALTCCRDALGLGLLQD